MAITLYARTKFRGDSSVISRDFADLRDLAVGRRPSSMTMTAAADAIVLFKNDDWHGGAMHRRGVHRIEDLGSRDDGGQLTFGASVASVRLTPFSFHFNITVVTNAAGTLPGGFTNLPSLTTHLTAMIDRLNAWYAREKALLETGVAQLHARADDGHFNLSGREANNFPVAWLNQGQVDLIVANGFDDGSQIGQGSFPWTGQTIVTALRRDGPAGSLIPPGSLAMNVAHEFGHFFGSQHPPAGTAASNIMTQGLVDIDNRVADSEQIGEWHTKLARNLSRRGNRID
jgi:hypothetical protein